MGSVSSERDLLIIGAGALGGRVGRLWKEQHPEARVTAETGSTHRHRALRDAGLSPRLRSEPDPSQHPFVLLSVPPSSVADYGSEATRATELFDRTGRLLITTSTAVYRAEAGETCTEGSPLADSPRAARLLDAEAIVREVGGAALRLAGLYDDERGPHRVFLRAARSPRHPDGLINLIHYDDAATLCLAALLRGSAGSIYVGCDGHPITRQEIVEAALRSERYEHHGQPCRFEGTDGPLGRRCNNDQTRAALAWQPVVRSFAAWAAAGQTPTGATE
jgi:hypothetical protein